MDLGFSCQVLLKLFSYCVKVKVNRQQLVKLEMNTLNVMLGTLNLVRSVGCKSWGMRRAGGDSSPPPQMKWVCDLCKPLICLTDGHRGLNHAGCPGSPCWLTPAAATAHGGTLFLS